MSIFEIAFAPVSLALRAMADIFIAVFPETAALVAKTVEEIKAWLIGELRPRLRLGCRQGRRGRRRLREPL